MKKFNLIILLVSIITLAYLISCSEDIATPIDETQSKEDSTTQSNADNLIIDAYISAQNIPIDSIRIDSTTGTRYFILERGNGNLPDFNDILSFHYQGRFIQETDSIFDTTLGDLAKRTDSLQYVLKGFKFNDLIANSNTGKDFESILDSLNFSESSIDLPLFSITRTYSPISFNYLENGNGLTNYVAGFRVGITNLLNLTDDNSNRILTEGSRILLLLPSAVAYGTLGNEADPDILDVIPANTPILFELNFVKIRN